MKAKEIAAMLQRNPEAEVVFAYPYGDYVGTTAAVEVSKVNRGVVQEHYSCGLKVVEDDWGHVIESLYELDKNEDKETAKEVLMLT
jgi:hypothetical protein